MHRIKKEENVFNLIHWLNIEASLRSRLRKDAYFHNNSGDHRLQFSRKSDNHAATNSEKPNPDLCLLGCEAKHLLSNCPIFLKATVDQRWEIVKQKNRCRKCLRNHHTNFCKKEDGTTCDKCTRRHHRFLHNEPLSPENSDINPQAAPFASTRQEASNHSAQETKNVPGLCPVQKLK